MMSTTSGTRLDTTTSPVLLFDGVCNLCESSVRFVIRRDRKARFRFASLQSAAAHRLLEAFDFRGDTLGSVVLIDDGRLYLKSRAALRVARQLDGAWPLLYYFFIWIPEPVSDAVYDFIGRRRYRWFGRKEACWLPEPSLEARFLDATSGQVRRTDER